MPEVKMHEKLLSICALIEKEIGFFPNNCLINYYLDGCSTMGYHSDATEDLKEYTGVAIVSLGSERNIAYRSKINQNIKFKYALKSGSLLYMDQNIQDEWVHAIPKQAGVGERISLTFRLIVKS